MSEVKIGVAGLLQTGMTPMLVRMAADPPEQGHAHAHARAFGTERAEYGASGAMPSAHGEAFQRFAERRRLVFCLRRNATELAPCAATALAEPGFSRADYELLLLAPILDFGGPSYADSQAWNADYRRRLGECPQPIPAPCAAMAGRIDMILAALDDDAAGIAVLDHDVRPRPAGLADTDFPATLFLPHAIDEIPAQCQVGDRRALHRVLHAVHEAGFVLDIDPGWRELID